MTKKNKICLYTGLSIITLIGATIGIIFSARACSNNDPNPPQPENNGFVLKDGIFASDAKFSQIDNSTYSVTLSNTISTTFYFTYNKNENDYFDNMDITNFDNQNLYIGKPPLGQAYAELDKMNMTFVGLISFNIHVSNNAQTKSADFLINVNCIL
ncbi:MAG: hypothetical protein LBV53_00165 [Mycoplasmataceae bacterium]|jgi:hypothetical protein|nr:hypothetical protein [Mycoplasmataceae bacterium]